MINKAWYLKPNVVIEPLIEGWYAWPHLIAPATSAMNVSGRHLKIMDSYLQAPQIHATAIKNPKMLGGPFMDYEGLRIEEIKKLKERTLENQKNLIRLAEAIHELDRLLKDKATGYSLESIYEMVPDVLKGYVELVYDLNNYPSYRFFESLLYHSEFYQKESQHIALWLTNNDERPFCLSTARLEEKHVLNIRIPFKDRVIDKLSRMKRNGGSKEEIASALRLNEKDQVLFNTFFTQEMPTKYGPYSGPNVRMRYFGHACILIETKEISVLVDPLISYYGYESSLEHFSDMDLPDEIDYVLITHNHQDHILFETLLPLRHKIKNIIVPRTTTGSLQDPNLKLIFNQTGFGNVIEIGDMEKIEFGNCLIRGIPFTGEHGDLNIQAKTCFYLAIDSFTFLFVADSRVVEAKLYQHIQKIIGDVDVIFLGMECDGAPLTWLYGPLLTDELAREKDQTRRFSGCNYEQGKHLIDIFNPREAYVYAMGAEPWVKFISSVKYTEESDPIIQSNLFVEECNKRGIISERLYGEKEILYINK